MPMSAAGAKKRTGKIGKSSKRKDDKTFKRAGVEGKK